MSTSDEVSTNGQEATATADAASFAPGQFCWWELSTPNPNGAKQFYGAVFGWSYQDMPIGPDDFYTMFTYDGKTVGACYTQQAEQQSQGIPPYWMSYVNVTNVDETAAKVAPAGGTLMVEPFDVMDVGRMAIIQDPTGAMVAAWQAKNHTGAQLVNNTGANCWNELGTTDTAKAGAFYSAVFGWKVEDSGMPGMQYNLFKIEGDERGVGGMYQITPEMGPIPPHWMPYIAVTSADDTAAKVTANGGVVAMGPQDIPGVGRFAVVRDPQGAHIAFLQPDMSAMQSN